MMRRSDSQRVTASCTAELARRCRTELYRALRPLFGGSRRELRRSIRDFVRGQRRDPAALRGLLRRAAAGGIVSAALVGSGPRAAEALDDYRWGPLELPFAGLSTSLAFGDLDGDGDPDLLVGGTTGTLRYFRNSGSASSFAFQPRTGTANPLNGVDVGSGSKPAFGDLDADSDLDLVIGDGNGNFSYFENT